MSPIRTLLAALVLLTVARATPTLAAPVLSEFMASNNRTLLDEDGAPSDWIEIHNPDDVPQSLLGWSLTDDPVLRGKWRFPDVTLPAHGSLVVFASGKNRTTPGALHTNFRLEASGEYLALFPPGNAPAATEFSPRFPPQETDIAYGIPTGSTTPDLLASAPVRYLVPLSASELPERWADRGFAPDTSWRSGTGSGFGLGFDPTPAGSGATNLARLGTATQSTTGFGAGAENALDGDPASYTHTEGTDNASTWTLTLDRAYELSRLVLHNRADCCGSRLRDITVTLFGPDGVTPVWTSPLLNPENALQAPASIEIDLFDLNVGAITTRKIQVARTPDPDLSGSGGVGNNDEDNVLSLGEVEVYGVDTLSFGAWIQTDLTDTLANRQSSAFVRSTFVLGPLESVTALRLDLRYDDGVAIYLNGQQIASRNAPADLAWNSRAVAKRNKSDAVLTETLDLGASRPLWIEGTNVLAFHLLNASVADPDALIEAHLTATSATGAFYAYLNQPTPGSPNNVGWNLGRVADTRFSVKRGFYDAPFDLEITTETPGAEIRYTTDGSPPTASTGLVYANPIRIAGQTLVRAAAFKRDYRPTNVDTHSFLFPAETARQPAAPAGFPRTWGSVAADYAMDPRITQTAPFASQFPQTLRALPSLSLVLKQDDLFGASRGLYANPERNGITWERATSMEWIEPDGTAPFQIDCGLRIQGGYFRARDVTQKHSLRLLFKDEYGPGRLREDLFHEFGAAREFDTLVLRAGANDGYAWDAARDTEQFLRDEFGRRLYLGMGQPSARGRFVHLYLNGLYWGVYNLAERPAEDFSATYLGGEAADWDAINSGEAKNGDLNAWNAFLAAARNVTNATGFLRLQGLLPSGARDPALPAYLDADNYIDYMLVNIWGGNWDWPNKNFWFGRDRSGRDGGFKFYLWDFENTMGNNRDRSPLQMVSPRADIASSWVGEPHATLRRVEEYRMAFADRVQKHMFHQGVLTPDALVARYRDMAAALEPAIAAETARWGDDHFSPPQDLTDWLRERDWLLTTYLPQRSGVVLAQLRAADLYPSLDAPEVSPFGGSIAPGSPVTVTTTGAELFYTTDGSDPRLPGGAPNPAATRIVFEEAPVSAPPTLVKSGQSWRFLDDGSSPAPAWKEPDFPDTSWKSGPSPLGYGDGDEATVTAFVDADPATAGIQRNATTFFRTTFDVETPEAYRALRVALTYDDAGAVYLNGTEILRTDNLPAGAGATTYASGSAPDNSVVSREPAAALLRKGRNVLAVEIHQADGTSSDISFDLELTGTTLGTGTVHTAPPIVLAQAAQLRARARTGNVWSALTDTSFSPGTRPATPGQLVVAELGIRPAEPTSAAERAVSTDRGDYEYVELLNIGSTPLDLAGVRFLSGVLFTFAPGQTLNPGARGVLARHPDAFRARYGTSPNLLGTFDGNLDAGGEEVILVDAQGAVIQRFTYGTDSPWPIPSPSLVLRRPESNPDPTFPWNWRASLDPAGSPGRPEATGFAGDPAADLNGNGVPDLVDYALGPLGAHLTATAIASGASGGSIQIAFNWAPAAEDASVTLEHARDLAGPWQALVWTAPDEERMPLGGGLERRTITIAPPDGPDPAWFVRLVVRPVR